MTIRVGQKVAIAVGKQVNRNGVATRQKRASTVTVQRTEPARNGKTRVFWMAMGYEANCLV